MQRGFIIWRGPSLFDGAPILAYLGLVSANRKIGPTMAQAWILPDVDGPAPVDLIRSGLDVSVCGDCPHRSTASGGSGACYVLAFRGPQSAWKACRDGHRLERAPDSPEVTVALAGRMLRLGAWGDPAAVPWGTWAPLVAAARSTVGYTHAWRDCDPALRSACMASCDCPADREAARADGWRTFRILAAGENRGRGESLCAALRGLHCDACGRCCGGSVGADVCLPVHGGKANRFEAWRAARQGA
jgi:hypothetical protein